MLVIAGIHISGSAQFAVMTKKAERAEYTVCIDSGHGGNDPGKVGINQAASEVPTAVWIGILKTSVNTAMTTPAPPAPTKPIRPPMANMVMKTSMVFRWLFSDGLSGFQRLDDAVMSHDLF